MLFRQLVFALDGLVDFKERCNRVVGCQGKFIAVVGNNGKRGMLVGSGRT